MKDMKTNRQLANTVSMCTKMRMLVGSADDDDDDCDNDDDDDNNVKNKTHTDNMTGDMTSTVESR